MLSTGKCWRVDIAGLGRAIMEMYGLSWGMGQSLFNHQELCMPRNKTGKSSVLIAPLCLIYGHCLVLLTVFSGRGLALYLFG